MEHYKYYTITLLSFFIINASGQKEDHVWLFGSSSVDTFELGYQWEKTTIDFSDIEPLIYFDSQVSMDFGRGNAGNTTTGLNNLITDYTR